MNYYEDLKEKENEALKLFDEILDINSGKFQVIIDEPNEWGVKMIITKLYEK